LARLPCSWRRRCYQTSPSTLANSGGRSGSKTCYQCLSLMALAGHDGLSMVEVGFGGLRCHSVCQVRTPPPPNTIALLVDAGPSSSPKDIAATGRSSSSFTSMVGGDLHHRCNARCRHPQRGRPPWLCPLLSFPSLPFLLILAPETLDLDLGRSSSATPPLCFF
jgi:hypothetical protein